MGFFFGFIPKKSTETFTNKSPAKHGQSTTRQILQQSKPINEVSSIPSEPKTKFRLSRPIPSSDVDFQALLKLLSAINLQLENDAKFGIDVDSSYQATQIIQQLMKEKRQLETIRKIITENEPAHLEVTLNKLNDKIAFLQQTLPGIIGMQHAR